MSGTSTMVGRQTSDRLIMALVIAFAFIWMIPILWIVGLSFKPNDELMRQSSTVFEPPYTVLNYLNIIATSSVFRWVINSTIVSALQTALVLVLATLAGYGFARADFPGRKIVFVLVLMGLAIPEYAVVIARFEMFRDLGLLNTYQGLILPGLSAPFGVFLMTQYFRAIPTELDEAAAMDNASRLRTLWSILLPLTVPAQATLGVFTFLSAWNEYFWPLIAATNQEMFTLTTGLASTTQNFAQSQGLGFLMAQSVFAGLPIIIVYIIFQKYIITAVSGSAVR